MSKYEERNYAPKARKLEKSDFKQYSNRSESWEASSSGCCDSLQKSREEQEEIREIIPPELPLSLQEIVEEEVQWYKNMSGISEELINKDAAIQPYSEVELFTAQLIYTREENESIREEDVGKTHQEGRQGIQESDQGRCETEETNLKIEGQKMKKQSLKERKHEAKETKAYEKKEDKKESKSKKK